MLLQQQIGLLDVGQPAPLAAPGVLRRGDALPEKGLEGETEQRPAAGRDVGRVGQEVGQDLPAGFQRSVLAEIGQTGIPVIFPG